MCIKADPNLYQIKRMRLGTVLIILALSSLAITQGIPKLPMYVGVSYNLLYGNPMTDHIDPGFQHQIFNFTYFKQEKTEDQRYLIPDQVVSRAATYCQFQSTSSNITGGQSYQDALKSKIKVTGGYQGLINSAAFTFSSEFDQKQKSTLAQNQFITQTTARCQAYHLFMNPSDSTGISLNFIKAATNSYKSNDWDKFISQFGTHYVFDVTMGGRATQEITYDSKSVTKMASLGVNIDTAAQMSFWKIYGGGGYNSTSNNDSSAYADYFSSSMRAFYIGGEPKMDNNKTNWQLNVQKNPMPIFFSLHPYSELFYLLDGINGFNASKAIPLFQTALNAYCNTLACQAAKPNKVNPIQSITITTYQSGILHGNPASVNGSMIAWLNSTSPITLNKIRCYYQQNGLKSLQFQFTDGVKKISSNMIGNELGTYKQWTVPPGEYITQVESQIRDSYLGGIIFWTNKGNRSPVEWNTGSTPSMDIMKTMETFPSGYTIIGYRTRTSSTSVFWLKFILGKVSYADQKQTRQEVIESRSYAIDE